MKPKFLPNFYVEFITIIVLILHHDSDLEFGNITALVVGAMLVISGAICGIIEQSRCISSESATELGVSKITFTHNKLADGL